MTTSDPFDIDALEPSFSAPTPTPAEPPYLQGLNPPQREAVLETDGPLLVLAGAGTGKTRALTTRLAHILTTRKAAPWEVLAVTFTNKAAREMKERVTKLVGPAAERMWIGTFHALCVRLLRKHAELVGLRSNFTILDTDDQIRLLKQLIQAEAIDDKRWPARLLAALIDRWKNRALLPDKLPSGEASAYANGMGGKLYAAYQSRLETLNAVDFGDLLLHVVTLLQNNPDVLKSYQEQFRYVLVDEYQDTNVAQYLWLRLLAQGHKNICCVGDDDQSIYGWRGAEVGNILRFETDFPGAKVIRLEQNYRSSGHILGAAGGLIAANETRLGKTLWTEASAGEPVRVRGVWDAPEEARSITDEIEHLKSQGHKASEIAILVRAGFQMREIEERLITVGLPYRVVGGPRFYERAEIRDALAYLRLVVQANDDLAFERIVNLPKRGLGAASLQKVHHLARAHGVSLLRAAEQIAELDDLRPQARRSLGSFVSDVLRWQSLLPTADPQDLAGQILDESGYTGMWQADKSPEAPGRLDNLKELVSAIGEFESLPAFLEHIALVMDNDAGDESEKLSVMTLHAAKGLEFDTVFLPGWEEGVFPSQRSLDENGAAGLEEERRLAYVGITRARKRAAIYFAANRQLYGQWQSSLPSRFIDELPGDHIEVDSRDGLFGASRQASYQTAAFDDWDQSHHDRYGPGWQRREARSRQNPQTIDGYSRRVQAPKPVSTFAVGERVFHDKFGYGEIVDIDGNKLMVAFDKAGEKRVMDNFVRAA